MMLTIYEKEETFAALLKEIFSIHIITKRIMRLCHGNISILCVVARKFYIYDGIATRLILLKQCA